MLGGSTVRIGELVISAALAVIEAARNALPSTEGAIHPASGHLAARKGCGRVERRYEQQGKTETEEL